MKKADLEKLKGRKLAGAGTTPDRFGKGAAAVLDKREQREREREMGLVPFAVKLHADLVRDLHAAAEKRGVGLNELTAELLRKGMAAK
ncbi:MAG TPA: hypothetical protein VF287_03260 [Usitatibacter sp.]|jgi:hypothetical protein